MWGCEGVKGSKEGVVEVGERSLVGIGLVQDVGDGLLDGVDAIGVLVGDLDAEFLLDGHDDLDGVEAVETEVIGEVGGGLDVGRVVDLVKSRQQAHDPPLNLLLVQATASAVHAHSLVRSSTRRHDAHGTGSDGDEGAGGSRSDGDHGGGARGRTEESGAEHCDGFFCCVVGR